MNSIKTGRLAAMNKNYKSLLFPKKEKEIKSYTRSARKQKNGNETDIQKKKKKIKTVSNNTRCRKSNACMELNKLNAQI